MLIGAQDFLAHVDLYRILSITGFRGACKDLLAFELSRYYLDRDYSFYSNQRSVWNDELYVKGKEYKLSENRRRVVGAKKRLVQEYNDKGLVKEYFEYYDGVEEEYVETWIEQVPWVRRRVYVLSEGGRYLRRWDYFEDMFEFARKMNVFIFIPSVRIAHAELANLICYPVIPFKLYFGFNGGLWKWEVDTGMNRKYGGLFWHIPQIGGVGYGVYDTDDLSELTTEVIAAFRHEIQVTQRSYGRDGIQALEPGQKVVDEDHLAAIARKLSSTVATIQEKGRKK